MLVATHLGTQHILHTSGVALACGVNLVLAEASTAAAQIAGMLALDGRCKTLDARADGYVRGEACAAMRLCSTQAGVRRLVVLQGTFVNQDGRSSSLTAPNGPSQQQV
jgi:acyl transferase domain-containing protein